MLAFCEGGGLVTLSVSVRVHWLCLIPVLLPPPSFPQCSVPLCQLCRCRCGGAGAVSRVSLISQREASRIWCAQSSWGLSWTGKARVAGASPGIPTPPHTAHASLSCHPSPLCALGRLPSCHTALPGARAPSASAGRDRRARLCHPAPVALPCRAPCRHLAGGCPEACLLPACSRNAVSAFPGLCKNRFFFSLLFPRGL